ncbi:MFS transporter [Devriesea agamarum]|uniref:MFS transporter n=1 Tax=Devriesea agamarum TaxID=472569 RepID=UPI000A03AEBD|nr:MFS transporter [Devriesea agamarum]
MAREFRTGPRGVAGVGVFFISNGAVFAGLLPWYPLMMQRLELSAWQFGLIVASFVIGAIVSSVLPSRLIARFRAVPVAVGGTLMLAVIAICGTTIEDVANNWSAIAAVQISHLPAASAGIAFSVVISSQCLGRFSGDALIQKRGRTWVARLGGTLIILGGIAILTAHEPIQLLAGLAAVGYGSATLVPSALGAAARIPGVSQAAGVTLVNWIMRVGFLVTSPLVGFITTETSLRWGLSTLLLVGITALALASKLSPQENTKSPVRSGN